MKSEYQEEVKSVKMNNHGNVVIIGLVTEIERGCPVQMASKGIILNYEDEEEEIIDNHHYHFRYGENTVYDAYYLNEIEELHSTMKSQPKCKNCECTLYFDSDKVSFESIRSCNKLICIFEL